MTRYRKVKIRFKEDIEPQEILLDSLAQKKEEELGVSEKKFEVPLSKKILSGFYIIFLASILILFGKTFQLQVLEGKTLSLSAKENKSKTYFIRTTRGVIYDRFGKQIVFNQSSFDLVADKANLPVSGEEKINIIKEVSEIVSKDFNELNREIESSNEPKILVAENLSHQNLLILEAKIAAKELQGFQIEQNSVRNYQEGSSFAHLIGYTGKINPAEYEEYQNYSATDYIGKAGLERSYEEALRGKPGILQIENDARGNKISESVVSDSGPGNSLILWLDAELQKKIEAELSFMMAKVGSQKAAAVALDPKTGGVLALVSLPSFDNNLFSKGKDPKSIAELLNNPKEPLFNRVISGTYPTGSTIKPFIATAALEEKLISPEKRISDPGYILVPNPWNPQNPTKFLDWQAHGWADMRKAIAVSCNVYFYTIGGGYQDQEGLGPGRIKKYLRLFGWGEKTQIDLPGEKNGFIPDPLWKKNYFSEWSEQVWQDGDTYNLSIGQGFLLVTPLQVATAFVAIANNGKLLSPQVVQKIVDSNKNVIEELKPRVLRENFLDPKNLQVVREGMRDGVIYGSSVLLNSLPVKAASKTGTAQTPKVGYYHNWVTVFAPYDDPQIVLTIIIENVKDVQAAVLPVAKGVLEWYFTREHNF